MTKIHVHLLPLVLLVGCVAEEVEPDEELELGAVEQAINGNDFPAQDWMTDRAVALVRWDGDEWKRFCTGTVISPNHVLTALHCSPTTNDDVAMYSSNDGFDVSRRRSIVTIQSPPGTNPATDDWDASNGQFSDIVVLTLSSTATGATPATLAWRYPGPDDTGIKVGAGRHDGDENAAGELRYVLDETYSDSDDENDGQFLTVHSRLDKGDSGGPFYDSGRVLGVCTGEKLVWGAMRGVHTSVPDHLHWILGAIGWTWPHGSIQSNTARTGTSIQTFLGFTERECAYACDKTSSCVAWSRFDNPVGPGFDQCTLLSSVSQTATISNFRSALK